MTAGPKLAVIGKTPPLDRAEAQQFMRLRSLQLRRAETALGEARQALQMAEQAVAERGRRLQGLRASRLGLQHAVLGALAPTLPRWAGLVSAQRDRLDDQFEREEYALIDDERALERAQDTVRDSQQAVARLQQREDFARELLQHQRRLHQAAAEHRSELEREELRR